MKIIDAALSLIFPRTCAVCREAADKSSEYALCRACSDAYAFEKIVKCADCGKPNRDCRCRPPIRYGKNTEYIHLIRYESDFSKRLVLSIKRRRRRAMINFLSGELARAIEGRSDVTDITFAPRSPGSVKKYGFDQSKLLAKATAKRLGANFITLFSHKKKNTEQKTLDLSGRVLNAQSSYELKKARPSGDGTLVIIDDIITSGSTTKTLCELAEFAGAEKIIVLTVAKVGQSKNIHPKC